MPFHRKSDVEFKICWPASPPKKIFETTQKRPQRRRHCVECEFVDFGLADFGFGGGFSAGSYFREWRGTGFPDTRLNAKDLDLGQ
jgi:hypothetical protein